MKNRKQSLPKNSRPPVICLFQEKIDAYGHCHRRHNTLLHRNVSNSSAPSKESLPSEPKETTFVNISSNQCADKISQCGRKLHKVVPVSIWVDNPCNSLTTWAFMDEGSETSLCAFELAKRLNAPLTDCKIDICTNNAVTPVDKKIKSICIQGVGESTTFEVSDVLVQKGIINVSSSIPSNLITQDYRHLADLNLVP